MLLFFAACAIIGAIGPALQLIIFLVQMVFKILIFILTKFVQLFTVMIALIVIAVKKNVVHDEL